MRQFPHKLYTVSEIQKLIKIWRIKGDQIVFTNGCFDILHPGHFHYLKESALLGNRLIVGLNSDESIKRLKGDSRPIFHLKNRISQLESIHYIDAIVVFEDETPVELIKAILPDVLTKGGDYKAEEIVGYQEVIENGGVVKIIPILHQYSTTNFVK